LRVKMLYAGTTDDPRLGYSRSSIPNDVSGTVGDSPSLEG
jgi:hypothetical protein